MISFLKVLENTFYRNTCHHKEYQMSEVNRLCKHEGLVMVTKYNNKQKMLVCQEVT